MFIYLRDVPEEGTSLFKETFPAVELAFLFLFITKLIRKNRER
jgi:hypothetical protein